MLILTRKINEEIHLGSGIVIKILGLSDNQVKIGLEAPQEILILRGELAEKIKSTTIDAYNNSGKRIENISGLKLNKMPK